MPPSLFLPKFFFLAVHTLTDVAVLLLCAARLCYSSEPPGDPTVSCLKFVSEGDQVTCECQARFLESHPPDFSLTWPRHSDTPFLKLTNVMRRDNGTVFTCLMAWNGQSRKAIYTLQVAYGPDDTHTTIHGPDTFITDGTKPLTLTCQASEVNPRPTYTWETRCDKEDQDTGTCTFTPEPLWDDGRQVQCVARSRAGGNNKGTAAHTINLLYPPRDPPVITGYTPGDTMSHASELRCSVSGGKPLVSKVILTCEAVQWLYTSRPAPAPQNGTVSSSLTVGRANGSNRNNSVLCTCWAVWEPQADLYRLTSQTLVQIRLVEDGDNNCTNDRCTGWIVGTSINAVLAAVSISVCVVQRCRRRKSRFQYKENMKPQENGHVYDQSRHPLEDSGE